MVAVTRPGGDDPVIAVDDRPRCPWPGLDRDTGYAAYHDLEWGRPVHGTAALFERLSLEAFQSGLSWLTILRRRPALRAAFAEFDPVVLARWDDAEVDRLVRDPGLIRNRRKIAAVLSNARRVVDGRIDLDEVLWSFAPAAGYRPRRPADASEVPVTSDAAVAMVARLRRLGLVFVGPRTAYALMQATGMVDDHVAACWLAS